MLKVASFDFNTFTQPLTHIVYDARTFFRRNLVPSARQSHFQRVNGGVLSSWDFLRQDKPHGVVHRFKSGEFGGQTSLPQKPGNSSSQTAIVDRAKCAGAQSCWSVKPSGPKCPDAHGSRGGPTADSRQILSSRSWRFARWRSVASVKSSFPAFGAKMFGRRTRRT